jgi:hypothetical protein
LTPFFELGSQAMSDESDFDDGLVHKHQRATEPFRAADVLEQLLTAWPSDDQYDHSWATQE